MSSRKVRSLIVSKLWSVDWVELSCLSIQSLFQHTPRNTSNLDELQVTLVSPVRVSSSILVDRTELFLYLDSFAVTIIRSVLCAPLPLSILDELLVHRCGLYLCSVNVALSLIEQELRLHLLSVMVRRRGYRYRLNFHSPPPWTMDVFSWECCHQCVRLPKLPRTDNWIISHHFWHYFGRATVPRKRPFCDPPGQSICSRPTLAFSWNRRGHIGLRGPTSPVEYKYRAIAKSTAQSRRFREFANLREPTRPADFISGSWNSYSSEA